MSVVGGDDSCGSEGPRPATEAQTQEHDGLLFITKYGGKWAQARVEKPDAKTGKRKMWSDDPVGKEFTKLLVNLKLKRPGLGFYALSSVVPAGPFAARDCRPLALAEVHADGLSPPISAGGNRLTFLADRWTASGERSYR